MVGQLNDYGVEVEGDVVARMEFANGARGLFFATNNNWTNESGDIQSHRLLAEDVDPHFHQVLGHGIVEIVRAAAA